MARNVGKTMMEENLGKTLSQHQGKILLVVGLAVLVLLAFSSRDYLSEYSGLVESIGLEDQHFTVHKRTHKKLQIMCATVRLDGESESSKICFEDPRRLEGLKPRHRFVKPRFRRYMESVGQEVEIPWLKEQPAAAAPATPAMAPAAAQQAPAAAPAAVAEQAPATGSAAPPSASVPAEPAPVNGAPAPAPTP